MKPIKAESYSIFFENEGYNTLKSHLNYCNYSKIFIHLDFNTNKDCLSVLIDKIKQNIYNQVQGE